MAFPRRPRIGSHPRSNPPGRAGGRLRRVLALAALASLIMTAVPWTALAQTGDYSGVAEGTAAEVQIAPGTDAGTTVTISESTGAVNSEGGIVPDAPASPEDESEDLAVGTATPIRVVGPDDFRTAPGSVQSSAPGDAGGSDSVEDVSAGPAEAGVGEAQTRSRAEVDGDTAGTENSAAVADADVEDGASIASIGAGTSRADVERVANGAVKAIGEAAINAPSSLLAGVITVEQIFASSRSNADGTSSSNVIDFVLENLVLGDAPGGEGLVTINAGPSGDPELVALTITLPGGATQELTVPRGSNLLDASTYAGSDLAFLTALDPVLSTLTGAGGPLEGSELILAGGFSDDGDGTYARGLIEVLRLNGALGGELAGSVVLGRAFSAADAERAFSTGTDPELPPGETPTSDPGESFPGPRTAVPAETIFTEPVEPGGPGGPGGPGDGGPGGPGDGPDGPGVPTGGPTTPVAATSGPADEDRTVAAALGAGAGDGALPLTGSDSVAPIATLGALLLLGGLAVGALALRPRRSAATSA